MTGNINIQDVYLNHSRIRNIFLLYRQYTAEIITALDELDSVTDSANHGADCVKVYETQNQILERNSCYEKVFEY